MQQQSFILFTHLGVDWTQRAVLTQGCLSCSCLSRGAGLGCLEDSSLTSLVPGLRRQNSWGLDLLGLSSLFSLYLSSLSPLFLSLSLFIPPSPSIPVSVYMLEVG